MTDISNIVPLSDIDNQSNMSEKLFDYVLLKQDNKEYVVRVLGEPTYQKVDLKSNEAYLPFYLPEGMKKSDYPGLFNISEENDDKYPTPFRKVMCHIGKCDFCNKIVGSDKIRQEYTDLENHMGYFYCNECEEDFIECLKRTGTRSIWYLRNRKEIGNSYLIWVPRTRRDENRKRINYGPYTFEKWRICGWYAIDHEDENGVKKPHIVCENETLQKLIPVDFIFELNPENNIDYNPNNDTKWK